MFELKLYLQEIINCSSWTFSIPLLWDAVMSPTVTSPTRF